MMRFWPLRNFRGDERGSASVFAICLLPAFLALGGLAIDGANAWRVRSIMQVTADSAALAAVTQLPNSANTIQMAQDYAAKNMPVASNGSVLANTDVVTGFWDTNARTFTPNGSPLNAVQVTVKRSAANSNALPTTLLSLIGVNNWNIVTTSIATSATDKLWVALVLDNTGSMTQTDINNISKIAALKTATHQLLTQLQNAATSPGDVEVAIVPFSKDVNVGTANINASWIDWTDWEAAPANSTSSSFANVGPGSTCPYTTGSQGYTCQSAPANGSSSTSTVPSSGTYSGYICPGVEATTNFGKLGHYYNGCYNSVQTSTIVTVCSGSSCSCAGHSTACSCTGSGSGKVCKQPTYTHNWVVNAHNTWNGCITDRPQSFDVSNAAPGLFPNFPSENAQSCVPSVLGGLSNNWSSLSSQVNAMSAGGSTNQTIGLAWGWEAMTQGNPLNPPAPPPAPQKVRQVMILLSDGLNTQDRWYGDGTNQSAQVDARMTAACNNAKAAGVTIYTVFVDLSGTQGNSAVLQACASDSNKYFDLTTSGEIISTFAKIAQQITYQRVVF